MIAASVANFTRLTLSQGSQDWHAWRATIIGASDAPVVMGENPWKSAETLLREKLGELPPFQGNAATRRGSRLEPLARERYRRQARVQVEPAVLQHDGRVWQGASLDGINARGTRVVEIKCGERVYDHARRYREPSPYYVGQLQHILSITDLDAIDFYCFLPDQPPVLLEVGRDTRYIKRLLAQEERFIEDWQARRRGRRPRTSVVQSKSTPAPARAESRPKPHTQPAPISRQGSSNRPRPLHRLPGGTYDTECVLCGRRMRVERSKRVGSIGPRCRLCRMRQVEARAKVKYAARPDAVPAERSPASTAPTPPPGPAPTLPAWTAPTPSPGTTPTHQTGLWIAGGLLLLALLRSC